MTSTSALYPLAFEEACDRASALDLDPSTTFIEPSRYVGLACDLPSAATLLKLTFNAERWPTVSDDVFLMVVPRAPEVVTFVKQCGYEFERVEITAMQFGSDADRARFERALWPDR